MKEKKTSKKISDKRTYIARITSNDLTRISAKDMWGAWYINSYLNRMYNNIRIIYGDIFLSDQILKRLRESRCHITF